MGPAMGVAWLCGLLMIAMGGLDFGSVWAWVKLAGVVGMSAFHSWLRSRQREFAAGQNTRSGRTYRMANEVPTVLMILIVVAVVVKPF